MYDYACIEMKSVHNATFPSVLRTWYERKSRIDENIYNVMRQLVESNCVVVFFLFERCFTS